MAFISAAPLGKGESARPVCVRYRLDISPERLRAVEQRLAELKAVDSWPVERAVPDKKHGGRTSRAIDLAPLVQEIKLENGVLSWTLAPQGDIWARPAEVLELLGLDGRTDLAETARTALECPLQDMLSK